MWQLKAKTHRGAAKRFKVTGSGKIVRNTMGKRHLLEHKSPARKRRLAGKREVARPTCSVSKVCCPTGKRGFWEVY